MTDHEKTCMRLGKWTPGMKCMEDSSCHFAPPCWTCPKCGYRFGQRDTYAHDVPCPPLTSDDISEWAKKEGLCAIIQDNPKGCTAVLYRDEEPCVFEHGHGSTLLAALENAVAKIEEAKE